MDHAAYRILQEALTNVLRHAGTDATATVRLAYEPGALRLEVVDDGVGTGGPPRGGHGIAGMTERAAALGGTLSAGPRADGPGFAVRAVLPTTGDGRP